MRSRWRPRWCEGLLNVPDIATPLVRWQAEHGRHDLPWQQTRDPYRVWLSEVMLQQTQVATVRGYYTRFLDCFPEVATLAAAPQDRVLALWSGLGYYTRARNLHRCAQQVMELHGGTFPRSAAALAQLPGIGRSTAGAIAAFCFAERVPILDANVRRVLTRVLAFDADLAQARHERQLWDWAYLLLPHTQLASTMPRYTQGLMDLGAQLCLPRKPQCSACPLLAVCRAAQAGQPQNYPVKTRKTVRRTEHWWLLLHCNSAGAVWLQPRAQRGIWAGLYCTPVFHAQETLRDHLAGGAQDVTVTYLPPLLHTLTHRDLHLHPVLVRDGAHAPAVQADAAGGWFGPEQWAHLGLPAPLRPLLQACQRSPDSR